MQNETEIDFNPSPRLDEKANSAASRATADPLDRAKGKAQQLASDAQNKTTEEVQSRLGVQKQRAAESLTTVAQSLRTSGEELQGEQDGMSRYVQQTADRVEGVASYLRDHEVGEIVDELEDFARSHPPVFVGGAFVIGLLGARFLKSSRRNLPRNDAQGASQRRLPSSPDANSWRDATSRPAARGYAPSIERAGVQP